MANIRDLKKDINFLTSEMITECMVFEHYHPKEVAKSDEVIQLIVDKRNELIDKINNPSEEARKAGLKKYYSVVVKDMYQNFVTLLDKLGA
jgi:hypothetical protein